MQAVEFLSKPFSESNILSVIRGVIDRRRELIDRDIELRALRVRNARLTSREREVLALVVVEKANKDVANVLGINEVTAKAHSGSMMPKMGAGSLAELANQAARLFLSRPNRKT